LGQQDQQEVPQLLRLVQLQPVLPLSQIAEQQARLYLILLFRKDLPDRQAQQDRPVLRQPLQDQQARQDRKDLKGYKEILAQPDLLDQPDQPVQLELRQVLLLEQLQLARQEQTHLLQIAAHHLRLLLTSLFHGEILELLDLLAQLEVQDQQALKVYRVFRETLDQLAQQDH
jgi:hypothetical protein